ncbi:MAG: alpha amylase, catalytic region [Frankiales bacterium]|nr:alpha amylase, catalytic region [Frankiales bacterium]
MRFGATVFREGHDAVAANVVVKGPRRGKPPFVRMDPGPDDTWSADVVLDEEGLWSFTIEGWSDPLGTWWHDAPLKIEAGVDVELMLEEGARLYERVAVPKASQKLVAGLPATLRDGSLDPETRLKAALDPAVVSLLRQHPIRELVTASPSNQIWVDRRRALYGSWYEFFPRSEGGTLATASGRLPAIAAMGFDVVYLPPIHPIGYVNRKGPNNSLEAGPDDPGSPWAIGSPEGGHDAIHPELGTFADFDGFVARAAELGMEVALDLALQCAPDHPWAVEHPEWFTTRADGTIAYAENPPKKYQDIYPLNFDNDPEGLSAEVLRVVLLWVDHGVKIFRVDNPHTKPFSFWAWLITEVKKAHPDVLFLAEAFTRPAIMHELGRIGFTQSYTYFTWRTGKHELQEYLHDLVEAAPYMRPNFFVNTPDILHASLQYGGPPAFKTRAVLAALLSPSWGVYSGFELYEHVAVRPGSEEYLDSEKYQVRERDWSQPSLAPFLTRLNRLRREHECLHWLTNLTFHDVDNEDLMAWSKRIGDDIVLVVLNLTPHGEREGTVRLNLPALGVGWEDRVIVHDELTGAEYTWGTDNYVRLDPFVEPAHVFTVRRAHPPEQGHWT